MWAEPAGWPVIEPGGFRGQSSVAEARAQSVRHHDDDGCSNVLLWFKSVNSSKGAVKMSDVGQARAPRPLLVRVAATCTGTRALGPGLRSVVWVQGCPFRCAGCL